MRLVIGRVVRPHGVRGDLICEVRTDEPEERFVAGSVLFTDPATHGPLTLESVRWYKERLLVTFEGVADRDTAEALRGVRLCVEADTVPAPSDPDEFRDQDLVGLTVRDADDGTVLGTVSRVDHAPAHDTLVMERPEETKPVLIPFVRAIVPDVDIGAKELRVRLPDGLLEL